MKAALMSIFLLGGLFFFSVGTVGLLRFPDLFTRAHSAAKCDTLGAVLSLIALMIYSGWNYPSLKLLLVLIFLWTTNPTATHLIAKAVFLKKENRKNITE
ncbi:monovalent cation/H(+) antiporter subunit G [Petroclostridium sp. X23]|uniref:monovalent cation/H(+) antiporter subunit G n=1 Tax=Petroclostridium sp. X23 TaxID=3045146 RepID=UPI0024ACB663|nr:monovalent cation/H(+) antiporter subunit G [Petroclostridium sp. X23]WHH58772.1 monovalent cation/H(+) antiporter subunit G [Petroclostridium sp. X23]